MPRSSEELLDRMNKAQLDLGVAINTRVDEIRLMESSKSEYGHASSVLGAQRAAKKQINHIKKTARAVTRQECDLVQQYLKATYERKYHRHIDSLIGIAKQAAGHSR